jgi:fumarate reductase flavoprotein subunit
MLSKEVTDNGGEIFMETTARSLLTQDGAVTGVVAERRDGSTLTVNAKAVVIATGGFGGDTDMVKEYSGYDVVCGCLTQDVGEGMKMAWDVGAAVANNIGGLQLHQTLATANLVTFDYFHMRMPMILGYVPSVLNVTKNGVRFRNEEWGNVATAASTGGAFVGGTTYTLIDQSTIDKLEAGGLLAMGTDASPGMPPEYKPDFTIETPWTDAKEVFDAMVAGGWGYYGETIEELAEAAGFDVATFTDTFETYQGYCRDGKDGLFNKDPKYLVEYEYGPYYLVEITYNQLGTVTGLVINARTQVLDTEGNPIPGLYSVGADASSVLYDHNYNGMGDAIGWAITSGYMGGESAAAYVLG